MPSFLRQNGRIPLISNRSNDYGFVVYGDGENVARFLDMEASHLTDSQAASIRLKGQNGNGLANIVERMRIVLSIRRKVRPRDREQKHRRACRNDSAGFYSYIF